MYAKHGRRFDESISEIQAEWNGLRSNANKRAQPVEKSSYSTQTRDENGGDGFWGVSENTYMCIEQWLFLGSKLVQFRCICVSKYDKFEAGGLWVVRVWG